MFAQTFSNYLGEFVLSPFAKANFINICLNLIWLRPEKTLDNTFWSILKRAIRGSNRDFTEGSIGVAIFILAVPMIIEMFAESLFCDC